MRFEIVGFHPIPQFKNKSNKEKKKIPAATVHVYLVKYKMDILGMPVFFAGRNVFVQFPHSKGWSCEEKRNIKFPCISFIDKNEEIKLMKDIRKKLLIYLENWWKENMDNKEATHVGTFLEKLKTPKEIND